MALPNANWQSRLALVLATVAGFVDVVGYVTLRGVFTAHMTGNTSRLGIALGHGNPAAVAPLAAVPVLFVAGIAAGTLLVDADRRWMALLIEAALIAGFMAYAPAAAPGGQASDHAVTGFYVLLALAALAMGVQTAALTQIQGTTIRTSYISGVVTNLAQQTTRRLRGERPEHRQARLLVSLCVCYLAGATGAAYGLSELGAWCLAGPVGVLFATAGRDRLVARRSADAG